MKTLQLSIIAIAGIISIGIASFAVILPQQSTQKIEGANKDVEIITIGNRPFHYTTVDDTLTNRGEGIQIPFHDVVFTLFPQSFHGGLPAEGCGGRYFWADAKFPDGIHELLHIFVDSQPCHVNSTPTHLSIHANPQAGLIYYDGKIRLLVSTSEDQMVTLTGDDALRVCAALGIPCPSNPTFHAKQVGNDTYVVVVEGNGVPYTVVLNDTTTCVSPALYGRPSCYSDSSEK